MMRSKSGERLYKRVTLKIFQPHNDKPLMQILKPETGKGFDRTCIIDILAAAAIELGEVYPQIQFRLVPLKANEFNLVPNGSRVNIAEIPKDIAPTA